MTSSRHFCACLPWALPLLLCACAGMGAGDGGTWPSLAHRPGEEVADGPCTMQMQAEPAAADAAAPPALPLVEMPPFAGGIPLSADELATLRSTFDEVVTAWEAQSVQAESAVSAATDAPATSPLRGTAEIALSRLEGIFGRTAPLDSQLAAARGALAPQEGPLAELSAAYDAFRDRHLATYNQLRQRLSGGEDAEPAVQISQAAPSGTCRRRG